MIGYLTGTFHSPNLLITGGVGYEVDCPEPPLDGTRASLYVHTSISDRGAQLYGFAQQRDRDLFRTLIGVNGVGPRQALALLRDVGADTVVNAIITGAPSALTDAAGIGPKAARSIVEQVDGDDVAELSDGAPAGCATSEAVDALVDLGVTRSDAVTAVNTVNEGDDTAEELVRKALAMSAASRS